MLIPTRYPYPTFLWCSSAPMSASDLLWPAHMTHSVLSSVSDLHSVRPTMCTLLRRAGVPLCRPMTVAETRTSTCICSNHQVRLPCIHQDTVSLPLEATVYLLCFFEEDAAGQRENYVRMSTGVPGMACITCPQPWPKTGSGKIKGATECESITCITSLCHAYDHRWTEWESKRTGNTPVCCWSCLSLVC